MIFVHPDSLMESRHLGGGQLVCLKLRGGAAVLRNEDGAMRLAHAVDVRGEDIAATPGAPQLAHWHLSHLRLRRNMAIPNGDYH